MLTIEKHSENHKLTAIFNGKLTTITARQFDEELSDLTGISELVLDFSGLESISSAGLRVLLALQTTMDGQGRMVVTNANETVNKVFVLTGFNRFLTLE